MTDDFSVPGPAAAGPLAVVVARVAELADRLGVPRGEVFRPPKLSAESGVPVAVVEDLLAGRPAGEADLQARFLQRFALLRKTRLKPDGRRYTQQEIADGAGMSRQQAGALINGDRRPTMEHCAAIQRFFKVHAGFLTAEDADALTGALRRVEEELRQRQAVRPPQRGASPAPAAPAGPLPSASGTDPVTATVPAAAGDVAEDAPDDPLQRLLQDHGVRGIAWRAAQLPTDKHRDTVTEWLDMLLENVRRSES
ncbi:helix-turn-helix transcriptional regulator [Streptomyces sp. B-S-A8]|uniref:Helix-turn-helix transcriptional regulator n=1 Tax=Streptomyces solicavernae TaxID=3043614 RepID=A0ABT6RSC6_9ACTN|nr:helix-turn-helix transcriptional regulator [Streptomyces sp. B-S-A8]MDI3387342.1 helix-turn-helix transcriptional regulator [Streptomyces sp. B-S-A8]